MKILIDNGHGADTKGKRSPDGRLLEYKYAREIATRIESELKARGYDAQRIVTEESDIALAERARRVNEICGKFGAANVILISVHCNAAGNGSWLKAGGWCAYTSKGQTKADPLATALYNAANEALADYIADFPNRKAAGDYDGKQRPIRTDMTDGDPDFEEAFYILQKTKCPAVLTENLFQDNKADVDYLLSEHGKSSIVALHVEGVVKYLKSIGR
ncbi:MULTISPECIES: N-acetylmuramoyl-L-alanine amidase [Muribaculaceae]|mgnify:CR=1 FL=1|uniref:N-acetylmuramoyl-L-alanine amidase n=1 Tax=Muribaculaceae TaxID=2005473 RepID=UPI000F48C34A|nr:N-acetylmuramoyl-L-alanine amidase [Muribaculum sp.]MCX4278714.1 N-acetylmuramoyl-L-alanine amidase [Muribaculum sp.]ROS90065.1 N-acetylmuramoyl-L-alanine amidase [Muribaculaceae bacterium Isolate-043 (Harlan)]ROT08766.1 N-acetylmuramoyl-L-alanine amidase [Muribaculaceae bacterium Isolate-037 (Harlan)]